MELLFQVFCDNKILQERQMLSWSLNFLYLYLKQAN